MKTALRVSVLILAVGLSSVTVRASSTPFIQGLVSGIELCPQSLCGAAVFTGFFKGRVGFNPWAIGTMTVAVQHGELPFVEDVCTPLGPGGWVLSAGFRKFEGGTTGELCYNGDNTWNIDVTMVITSGGSGTLNFDGTLDHNVFPPTVKGVITQ